MLWLWVGCGAENAVFGSRRSGCSSSDWQKSRQRYYFVAVPSSEKRGEEGRLAYVFFDEENEGACLVRATSHRCLSPEPAIRIRQPPHAFHWSCFFFFQQTDYFKRTHYIYLCKYTFIFINVIRWWVLGLHTQLKKLRLQLDVAP